ncbi:hypothetical protein BG015_008457 [Linnemannia schmuckeri]|uniref:Uncharacterized protein n=1 Tax=Linnemannia schmuckeri TaxID=64567 RepID=A0A9P5S0D5_9FUNG|nr:hypothetical protein BG015_008457 [Linnemannia schmuckeri]
MSTTTPTSLSSLEQYTWASPLAPSMEPDEYVFILSCLQPYVDMARLCRMAQRKQQSKQPSSSIVLALSCMNQYEIKRACQEWRAIIVHIDPECTALQRSVAARDHQFYLWSTIQTVIWGTALAAVGLRQNNIIRHGRQWPSSRLASVCAVVLGCMLTASCAVKTLEVMKAIPRGYDVVKIRDEEAGSDHLFLVRRDYTQKYSVRIVPMYLLSGLGLGTMILGARIAFKIKKIAN